MIARAHARQRVGAHAALIACAVILSLYVGPRGVAAVKMDAMDRLFYRPNPAFTDRKGKDGDFVRFDDTTSSSGEEEWCRVEQKPVPEGTTKGRYQATRRIRPNHWVRSEDPDHPNMRIPVRPGQGRGVNLLPENSFWKDHDSEMDGGHPNEAVMTILDQNSNEISDHFWKELGKFELDKWKDTEYEATAKKYGLRDIENFEHLMPKLWFEPMSSESEEEERNWDSIVLPANEDIIPHMGHPFCVKCKMMLGVPRPELGLLENPLDPHCRFCGFINAHDLRGRLLNDPEVQLLELQPSATMTQVATDDADEWFKHLDDADCDPKDTVSLRKETEQRCDTCGYNRCYYWTAQVRSIDEGATAFFECMKCQSSWNVAG